MDVDRSYEQQPARHWYAAGPLAYCGAALQIAGLGAMALSMRMGDGGGSFFVAAVVLPMVGLALIVTQGVRNTTPRRRPR